MMSPQLGIEEAFRLLLIARSPVADLPPLADEMPLGAGGLGLDSIAMADLLLDCGERFGIAPPVSLLAEDRLTVGRVVDCLRRTLA